MNKHQFWLGEISEATTNPDLGAIEKEIQTMNRSRHCVRGLEVGVRIGVSYLVVAVAAGEEEDAQVLLLLGVQDVVAAMNRFSVFVNQFRGSH